MLHIIGLLLKILGIILAVIVGIIVLLVCIVLFVPVRYEISAEFPGKLEDVSAKVRFSWLLRLVAGEAGYVKQEFYWKMRAAWFTFSDDEEKSSESVKEEVEDEIKDVAEAVEEKVEEAIEKPRTIEKKTDEPQQKVEKSDSAKKEEPQQDQPPKEKTAKKEPEKEDSVKEDSKKEKVSFFQKIKNKIKAFWEKIKYTFSQICDKIKNVSEIKDKITDFLTDEPHKQAFRKAKKEIKWIISFLKPKKFKLNLHYGFEDPYQTGQVLAVLSMIYPFVGDNMSVQPDFENQIMEGELYIKGKLRMIYPAIYLIKLILDKNVRTTFIDVKNFKLK